MKRFIRTLQHSFRDTYEQNPLLGGLLLNIEEENLNYKKRLEAQKAEIGAKKAEIQNLEEEFEKVKGDTFSRSKIWSRMEEVKRQIKALERADFISTNLLQNGLRNNVDHLAIKLSHENDLIKRGIIEKKIETCNQTLFERTKPLKNLEDINEAKDQIQLDNYALSRLETGTIDQIDVGNLLNSDLLPFFDAGFIKKLKEANEGMGRVQNVIAGRSEIINLVEGVDQEWFKHVEECQGENATLSSEKLEIELQLANSNDQKEKVRLLNRLNEIEKEIKYTNLHIKNDRLDWTNRKLREKESNQKKKVIDFVDPETLIQLRQVITEARDLKLGKFHEYLEEESKSFDQEMIWLKRQKDNKAISPETFEEIKRNIKEAKLLVLDKSIEDPATLKQIAENFKNARKRLQDFGEEMEVIQLMRPSIEEKVKSKFGRLKGALASIPEADLIGARRNLLSEASAKEKNPENSAILKKDLAGLDFLLGNSALKLEKGEFDLKKSVEEIEKKLNGFGHLSNEEIKALTADLDTYTRLITDRVEANKAHKTIGELENAQDLDSLQKLLISEFGEKCLQVVSHKEFEVESKKYSREGYMVFYQKGDDWKIVLDEQAFVVDSPEKMPARVEQIKAQLTHELLHLEFEKNHETKEKVRKQMIEDNPKHWIKLKNAFLEMAQENKKTAPLGGQNWFDDDILSELFAMQNEMGNELIKEDDPRALENPSKAKLNNLLVDTSVSSRINDLIKDYAEAPVIGRGYEEGFKPTNETSSDKPKEDIPEGSLNELAEAVHLKNQTQINKIYELLDELGGSSYLQRITDGPELIEAMRAFNAETGNLNDALRGKPGDLALPKTIEDRNGKLTKDIQGVHDAISGVAKNLPNEGIGFIRNMWNNTRFLSLADFVKLGSDVQEFFARRLTRRNEDNAAALGMALFTGTTIGSEARARQQKSEAGEVSEWKSRYENLDAWQVIEELEAVSLSISPNKDQLKAILRILVDKGRLDWLDQRLWKLLNRLQSTTEFKLGDESLMRNSILLREKLQLAFGTIFDNGEFPDLERTNQSNYDGNKSKYAPIHDRMPTQLTSRLDELLAEYRAGKSIDPHLYESIIEDCMTKGRSYGENVMFHLIAGMAYGLLLPDRGLALVKNSNGWPPIEWLGTLKPPYTQKDFERLCKDNFKDSFEAGTIDKAGGQDFKSWFWTTVQTDKMVIGRAKKSVSERNWDHDWGRTIVCLGDADTAQRFFQGRGGQKETKPTAVGNTVAGMVQLLEENAMNRKNASKSEFSRIAGIMAMTEGILNGTAYNSSGDTYTRETAEINNEPPREGTVGRHGKKTTKEHRNIYMNFLTMLDEELFGKILKGEVIEKGDKVKLATRAVNHIKKEYPDLAKDLVDVKDIDQVYSRIGLITSHIINKMSDTKFQGILDKIEAQARMADAENAGVSVDPKYLQILRSANDGNYGLKAAA